MSSKNLIDVLIDGKIYQLYGYESEEYLQRVASYINVKISDIKKEEQYRRKGLEVQRTMVEINIADDYFKAKKQADLLEADLDNKDQQLYNLKCELIATQIRLAASEKEVSNMQKEIVDYQKEIIRYETLIKERDRQEGNGNSVDSEATQ
ncbi:MAG: cell division protein ZapA [Lachnospiraceae bacterium]|nr:cell division protein ZapA [Lachnospiraceae bacterium]